MTAADPTVLLLAPTERDAHFSRAVLREAELPHRVFRHVDELTDCIDGSAGAVVLTEAALDSPQFPRIVHALSAQPAWSDLPVVILSDRGAESPLIRRGLDTLGNVTLLERPVRVDSLLSVLRASLRARQRQHQVRDQLVKVANLNQKLEQLAFFDPLTALPNRDLLRNRLTRAMARVHRKGGACAVLFLDLDDFKVINDSLGHRMGDRALQILADRLHAMVGDEDTVARLGGDEFVMVLSGLTAPYDAAEVARQVLRHVAEPFLLFGRQVRLTTSIGIATYTGGRQTVDDLVKQADMAMYHAKMQGKRGFEYFTDALQRQAVERLTMERELRLALDSHDLILHYQPRVRLHDRKVVGLEALVRWNHPTRGFVEPDAFVPLAEETGLVWELGQQVLEQSCRQMQAWHEAGHHALRLSVNLSARQLQHAGAVEAVDGVLRNTGLPPHMLELELTESATMARVEHLLPKLAGLKELGLRLAIDDFGTGYSSLAYLQRLPIDAIKIDRGFLGDGQTRMHKHNRAIVHAIVALGSNLGISLVGEGIETDAQRRFLTRLGCDEGQGFLFGAPTPAPDITGRLPLGA